MLKYILLDYIYFRGLKGFFVGWPRTVCFKAYKKGSRDPSESW